MKGHKSRVVLVSSLLGLFLFGLSIVAANSLAVGKTGLMDATIHNSLIANTVKPPECAALDLKNIVTGSGTFSGSSENDLILGSGGDDIIDGLDGNDCILGGGGNDRLLGGCGSQSGTVRDEFNTVSYNGNNGPQSWAGDWTELGESDGPVSGDVNVEVPQGRGNYTLYSDQDSWIEQHNPNNNYAADDQLKVRTTTNASDERAVYHYDLTSLPAGSNVLSATAYFWVVGANASPVNVHRITAGWSESAVTWANISGAYDSTPVGSFTPANNNRYVTVDVTTLVRGWVTGGYQNNGLTLISTVSNETKYSSKEATGNVGKPYIVVEISSGGGVNTQSADQDSWIEQHNPNNNYAADDQLKVRTTTNASDERAVYHYDLASLPAGSNVLSAIAYFWVVGANASPVNVHRITAGWSESTVTWANISGAYDSTPVGSFTPANNNQYVSVDVTTLVRGWLNGTYQNNGLTLISTVSNETKYSSKEATGNVKLPYLTIVFERGGPAQALRIQNANKGVSRQVKLCGSTSATLQFSYLRQGLDDSNDSVAVQISNNGGASWTELARFAGPANDSQAQSASFDITPYIAYNTVVRFLSSPQLGPSDQVYFDNVQVSYTGSGSTGGDDVLLGGPGDDNLDGGPGTDVCYGGEGTNAFTDCETVHNP